jgi:ribosomal protein S6--L-glutamate ligase
MKTSSSFYASEQGHGVGGRIQSGSTQVVALEARLRDCRNVLTLGVKPNFADYTTREASIIRQAKRIYYPSSFYAQMFDTQGKSIFPSYQCYTFAQDKIKQSALFALLSIPHPRTRTFYGKRSKRRICDYFSFPMVGKIPRGSAMGRGVYLLRNPQDLKSYLAQTHPAYIQEYYPARKDLRMIIIGNHIALAYWRLAAAEEFRCNVALGGRIDFDHIPPRAIQLALHTARMCKWNDVGIDIIEYEGAFYVLEANMKYGREGFRRAGIDYMHYMEQLIADARI